MHRSGTSAIARGLRALSVYLGENFFDPQPDNPTGYWEDKTIVRINQRVLEELRLKWDDTALIDPDRFRHYRIRLLRIQAVHYLKTAFGARPLWGFKDPRTIRLLPFWRSAMSECGATDEYVLAIRNPLSVAASLFRRQQIMQAKAQLLWLVHTVPFLHELQGKPFVVVDYDLLTLEPRAQLERIARRLGLTLDDGSSREIERFAADFLDTGLRHSVFSPDDLDATTDLARLTRDAYLLLRDLATDGAAAGNAAFWAGWDEIARDLRRLDHDA